jgi:hypothetical protein
LYSHTVENAVVGLLRDGYGSFNVIRDSTNKIGGIAGFGA